MQRCKIKSVEEQPDGKLLITIAPCDPTDEEVERPMRQAAHITPLHWAAAQHAFRVREKANNLEGSAYAWQELTREEKEVWLLVVLAVEAVIRRKE